MTIPPSDRRADESARGSEPASDPAPSGTPPPANPGASSLHAKHEAWSGRFAEPVADFVLRYTASVGFDRRLAQADIDGSLAHAAMLAQIGVLSPADLQAIEQGLGRIRAEIESGRFDWRLELEDVHLNIEARLTELIGDAGKRLHTGRSRNDQVATDIRLFLRARIDEILVELRRLQRALVQLAAAHTDTIMPGFTHLQVAQPVVFGHHLLAYVEMLERDAERLAQTRARLNVLPLGAAALAGTTYPIDRAAVARQLGFDGLCRNSLDAVSDRDFAIEFCAAAALAMVHLSRLAEELVLWVSPRFDFIALPDRFTTGSSIMPQKRNPDVPELARGKTGRVVGSLVALLTLVKGQPLAYNKDNQEDKEPLFDAVDTLRDTLHAFAELVPGIVVHPAAMRRAAQQGFATATDLADYLTRKGLPFRDAHEAVGRAVRFAAAQGCDLGELTLEQLRGFAAQIDADALQALTLEGSVAARNHVGGTAPAQVASQAAWWQARLAAADGH
jgi:argininosuccinate lyase